MPFGINLRVNGDASPYWELVDRASALEADPTIRAMGYPPHITLAKYDEVGVDDLKRAINKVAEGSRLTLTFDRLGSFDPGFLILWAAPTRRHELEMLHELVHSMINPARCNPAYRPSSWVPHCTIALRVDNRNRSAANRLLDKGISPFSLTFDVVDFVAAPPIAILGERKLKPSA